MEKITASTKITMIGSASFLALASLIIIFLMFFPLKVNNPQNGINQKLIENAAAKQTTVTTQPVTTTTAATVTTTSFVNTRQTTDPNRKPAVTTVYQTQTVYQVQQTAPMAPDMYEAPDPIIDDNGGGYGDGSWTWGWGWTDPGAGTIVEQPTYGGGDPGISDPGTVDPGVSDPGTVDPGTADPGTGSDPGAGVDPVE